jgi:hypothetical protein
MEILLVKVDTKENQAFLRELLLKFNFVVEVEGKSDSVQNALNVSKNVAGIFNSYSDKDKIKEEDSIWEKVIKQKHGIH